MDDVEGAGPSVAEFVAAAGKDMHRVVVVSPGSPGAPPYLEAVFANAGLDVPPSLASWEDRVDDWCDDYRAGCADHALVEVNLETAVVVFDRAAERVVVAYGLSHAAAGRDHRRMRAFPDVNVGVRASMGKDAFVADRGHFLSHAAGGELDINLFPQRRELNRGWSEQGKLFRRMERLAAASTGTFHYHRPLYDDGTWIPASLEYGVLRADGTFWVETFRNK